MRSENIPSSDCLLSTNYICRKLLKFITPARVTAKNVRGFLRHSVEISQHLWKLQSYEKGTLAFFRHGVCYVLSGHASDICRVERSAGPSEANRLFVEKMLKSDNVAWFHDFVTALQCAGTYFVYV